MLTVAADKVWTELRSPFARASRLDAKLSSRMLAVVFVFTAQTIKNCVDFLIISARTAFPNYSFNPDRFIGSNLPWQHYYGFGFVFCCFCLPVCPSSHLIGRVAFPHNLKAWDEQ